MVGYVFILLIGLVVFITGLRLRLIIGKVGRWPLAAGRITHKEVVPKRRATGGRAGTSWELDVRYTYEVAGQTYTGEKIRPYFTVYQRRSADRALEQLPAEPQVRYNPADPAEAYLFSGSKIWPAIAISLGGIFALLGLLLLI